MNKRISTLMIAAMAMGTVSAAFAATVAPVGFDKLESGKAYYVVADLGTPGLDVNDVSMGMATNFAVANSVMNAVDDAAFATLTDNNKWIVTKDGNNYRFVNVATEKALTFTKDGAVVAAAGDFGKAGNIDQFQYMPTAASKAEFQLKGYTPSTANAGKVFLSVTSSATELAATGTPANGYLFVAIADKAVEVADLQKNGSDFSLNFEGTPEGANVFNKVTVVTVSGGTSDFSSHNTDASKKQFYLMAEGDMSKNADNKVFALGTAAELAAFKAAKFIVLSPAKADVQGLVGVAEGFKYEIVTGDKLVNAADDGEKKANTYAVANAKFTATTNTNLNGKLFLSQEGVIVPSADGKKWATGTDVFVGLGGKSTAKVVTSVADADAKALLTAGKGTAVDVKDLVKGKMIVNVLVKEGTLFSKALGMNSAMAAAEVAAKAGVNMAYPVGQWVVSAVEKDNTITLINRETQTAVTGISLYKTATEGVYSVLGSSLGALNDQLIKFQEVAATDMYAGYLNLTEKELEGYTYKLATKGLTLSQVPVDVYWKQSIANIVPTTDADEAIEWALTKYTAKAASAAAKPDTIFVVNTFNYYDAEGAKKEGKDSVAMFAYSLKGVNTETPVSYIDLAATYALGTAAQKVVLKEVAKNTYKMVYAGTTGNAPDWDGSEAAKYDGTANKLVAGAPTDAINFTLEVVEPAASYIAKDQYIKLVTSLSDYAAVNSKWNGVIANEQTELKATADDFKFWLYSADTKDVVTPTYYIAHDSLMAYNAADSVKVYADEVAAAKTANDDEACAAAMAEYAKYVTVAGATRLKFQPVDYVAADTLALGTDSIKGGAKLNQFKFNLLEGENGGFWLKNGQNFVANVNGDLVIVDSDDNDANLQPAYFDVEETDAPTANDATPSVSEVKVIALDGAIRISGAQGKKVVVSNILGQVVANTAITSDDATIAAQAGLVVVAVEGEEAVKAIVQ